MQKQLADQQVKLAAEYERRQKDLVKDTERKQRDFEDRWGDVQRQ